jgi:lipopolysaccharide biosynthesis glycosyltransferase
VTEGYRMDKDPERLFVHFCGRPKPWVFWVPSALRHYEATVSVVDWARKEKLLLPGPVPVSFRTSAACRPLAFLGARPREFIYKVRRKLGL